MGLSELYNMLSMLYSSRAHKVAPGCETSYPPPGAGTGPLSAHRHRWADVMLDTGYQRDKRGWLAANLTPREAPWRGSKQATQLSPRTVEGGVDGGSDAARYLSSGRAFQHTCERTLCTVTDFSADGYRSLSPMPKFVATRVFWLDGADFSPLLLPLHALLTTAVLLPAATDPWTEVRTSVAWASAAEVLGARTNRQ